MKCKLCGNDTGNETHVVHEMMFGRGEPFEYVLCAQCGVLQIAEIPPDLAPYYAGDYYSHQQASGFRGGMEGLRDKYALSGKGLLGRALSSVFPNQAMASLRRMNLPQTARILDVGCGSGVLLHGLKRCGFRALTGADPFAEPVDLPGLQIKTLPIEEVEGEFDLIMYHHSFEHLEDPLASLLSCHKLLAEGGTCIIRVPVMPCAAWERFGVNWAQIDAPRHFFIHSSKSMERLADQAGFTIQNVTYDSTAFQFWCSEQYERGIPMMDERSFFVSPMKSDISFFKVMNYARKAARLNAEGNGDQAIFYLKKTGEGAA